MRPSHPGRCESSERNALLPQPGGFEPNRPCRLAPDDVVDLEDLRLAWLDPHVGQYRHQTLAERLPLLPRVPDLANTDAAIHEEGDVVFQPIRGELTAIPFQAADGFVVLRRGGVATAGRSGQRCSSVSSPCSGSRRPYPTLVSALE